jgi:hypothetical protein
MNPMVHTPGDFVVLDALVIEFFEGFRDLLEWTGPLLKGHQLLLVGCANLS